MKLPDTNLNNVELSARARRVLRENGFKTVGQLAMPERLQLDGASDGLMREFAAVCVRYLFTPNWLKTMTIPARGHVLAEFALKFAPLSGPYTLNERWMLELAVAQLGPSIEWGIYFDGSAQWLLRSRAGYKEVEEEI